EGSGRSPGLDDSEDPRRVGGIGGLDARGEDEVVPARAPAREHATGAVCAGRDVDRVAEDRRAGGAVERESDAPGGRSALEEDDVVERVGRVGRECEIKAGG